jgi:hypothetical protein
MGCAGSSPADPKPTALIADGSPGVAMDEAAIAAAKAKEVELAKERSLKNAKEALAINAHVNERLAQMKESSVTTYTKGVSLDAGEAARVNALLRGEEQSSGRTSKGGRALGSRIKGSALGGSSSSGRSSRHSLSVRRSRRSRSNDRDSGRDSSGGDDSSAGEPKMVSVGDLANHSYTCGASAEALVATAGVAATYEAFKAAGADWMADAAKAARGAPSPQAMARLSRRISGDGAPSAAAAPAASSSAASAASRSQVNVPGPAASAAAGSRGGPSVIVDAEVKAESQQVLKQEERVSRLGALESTTLQMTDKEQQATLAAANARLAVERAEKVAAGEAVKEPANRGAALQTDYAAGAPAGVLDMLQQASSRLSQLIPPNLFESQLGGVPEEGRRDESMAAAAAAERRRRAGGHAEVVAGKEETSVLATATATASGKMKSEGAGRQRVHM